jgi:hypothetical protein
MNTSPDIMVMKLRRMRRVGHVPGMGRREMLAKFWLEILNGRDN